MPGLRLGGRGGGGGGGGGGGVPTYNSIVTANTTLARAPWQVQPVGTSSGAVAITLPASAQLYDRVDIADVDRSFGTHAITVNGGGHNVEDPENAAAALASSWVSPSGFSTLYLAWVLLRNSSGTLFWKAVQG